MKLKFENGNTPSKIGAYVVNYSRAGSREVQTGAAYHYGNGEWSIYGPRGFLGSPVTEERGKLRQRTPTVHSFAKVS